MKNFEKYIDGIVWTLNGFECEQNDCNRCCAKIVCDNSGKDLKQWLLADYVEPCPLSHDEYVILKNVDSEWKYIRRHRDNTIHLCNSNDFMGSNYYVIEMECFNHLFQFIKFEDEPYEIAKLIEDYEKEHGND